MPINAASSYHRHLHRINHITADNGLNFVNRYLPDRKRVLVHLELERTNRMTTNLIVFSNEFEFTKRQNQEPNLNFDTNVIRSGCYFVTSHWLPVFTPLLLGEA